MVLPPYVFFPINVFITLACFLLPGSFGVLGEEDEVIDDEEVDDAGDEVEDDSEEDDGKVETEDEVEEGEEPDPDGAQTTDADTVSFNKQFIVRYLSIETL